MAQPGENRIDSTDHAPVTSSSDQPSRLEQRLSWSAAIIVAMVAAGTYVWIADWPAGTHADEMKKASFILSWNQDFNHPVLSLQAARLANYFLGYTDPHETLRLGRTISGLFGGILVFATFVLGRQVLRPATAAAAAAAVAVTPLVAIHATFLKEDIYFAGPAILGLAGLVALIKDPKYPTALATGIAFGLAFSGKYIAGLFVVYAALTTLVALKARIVSRLSYLAVVVAAVAAVFAIINAQAFLSQDTFASGVGFELKHATGGHDVVFPIWVTGGIMHLRDSLAPGLGIPLLVLGLAGFSSVLLKSPGRRSLAIIAGAALLWYAAHEASPLKPFPNFERYMVPEGPLLLVLGAAFIEMVSRRMTRFYSAAAVVIILAAAVPAAHATYEIVRANAHDPRRVVNKILPFVGPQTVFDRYTTYGPRLVSKRVDRSQPLDTLITSSFVYDRFSTYGNSPEQPRSVRDSYDVYFANFFRNPYLEISSGGPSFAFLNPIVRIVAFDGDIDRLARLGEAAIEADPQIQIDIDVGP